MEAVVDMDKEASQVTQAEEYWIRIMREEEVLPKMLPPHAPQGNQSEHMSTAQPIRTLAVSSQRREDPLPGTGLSRIPTTLATLSKSTAIQALLRPSGECWLIRTPYYTSLTNENAVLHLIDQWECSITCYWPIRKKNQEPGELSGRTSEQGKDYLIELDGDLLR